MDINTRYSSQRSRSRRGPLEKRSCTDCPCLIGFSLFIIIWAMLANFAYQNTDSQVLFSPTDSNGQVCGVNKTLSDRQYLFFFDLTECTSRMIFAYGCQTPQVCIKNCPDIDWSIQDVLTQSTFDWPKIQEKLICVTPDLNKNVNSVETLKSYTSSNLCAKYYIRSKPLLNYCVPMLTDTESLKNFLKNNKILLSNIVDGVTMVEWMKDSKENAKSMADDLLKNYEYIIGGLLIAVLFSLVYILLLRWFSWIIIWVSLFAIVALMGFVCYESYMRYLSFNDVGTPTALNDNMPTNLATGGRQSWIKYVINMFNKKSTWLAFTVVSAVAFIVLMLVIIFLRQQIRLSTALIVEGSRAILDLKTTMMFPLVQGLLYMVVIMWFLVVTVYLFSMQLNVFKVKDLANDNSCYCNNSYKDGDWCTELEWERYCSSNQTVCKMAKCAFADRVSQDYIIGMQLFNLFGMFWLLNFVSGFSQMVLAITFASWYWTLNKDDVPFFSLTMSVYKTIRYHLGTIAFGSLIIAICNFLRVILLFIETNLKKYDNSFTRAIFTCMKCFFWLLNKFLVFINRNAYIMCAMYGNNFYTSAKKAFDLLVRNIVRVGVLEMVTDFIFFVGKITVTVTSMAAFYFEFYEPLELIKKFAFVDKQPELHYKWLPMIIVAAGSWVISSTFFHVYSITIDTLFLCSLEDYEKNDGSADRPHYMSEELMNILDTKNVSPRSSGILSYSEEIELGVRPVRERHMHLMHHAYS